MRLSLEEQAAIVAVISETLKGQSWEARLYGSRVDDTKRGGDIDLAIILHADEPPADAFNLRMTIAAKIKRMIGEQKIDLSILGRKQLAEPFWEVAFESYEVLGTNSPEPENHFR